MPSANSKISANFSSQNHEIFAFGKCFLIKAKTILAWTMSPRAESLIIAIFSLNSVKFCYYYSLILLKKAKI